MVISDTHLVKIVEVVFTGNNARPRRYFRMILKTKIMWFTENLQKIVHYNNLEREYQKLQVEGINNDK